MTLEYIKKHLYNTDIFPTRDGIVKDICNVFESKTCENCKHYEPEYENEDYGICLDSKYMKYMFTDKEFGCNKFEIKTE